MTIREIAKIANVSPATVSLVLNNKPGVNPARRKYVQGLLHENGYVIRNQDIRTTETPTICLIKFSSVYHYDEFTLKTIDTLTSFLQKEHYSLKIAGIDAEQYEEVLANIDYGKIKGMIFIASEFNDDILAYTMNLPVPKVYLDIYSKYLPINTVNADHRYGSYLAARYLNSLGHRKIGYLKGTPVRGCMESRFKYFSQALEIFNMEIDTSAILNIDINNPSAEEIRTFIERSPALPTAFLADSDAITASFINALQTFGIRVPDDISIIGFDNTKFSTLCNPAITSIDVHVNDMARIGGERLLSMIETPDQPICQSYVSPSLIIRDSTKERKS